MKRPSRISLLSILSSLLLLSLLAAPFPALGSRLLGPDSGSLRFQDEATPTATTAPSSGSSFARPVIILTSYSAGVESVAPGDEINLIVKFHNAGQSMAFNLVVDFPQGDFFPRATGGVLAIDEIDPDETTRVNQPLTASWDIVGKAFANVQVQVSYTDESGAGYSETFNITIPVTPLRAGPTRTPTPTATSAAVLRPQLVITAYNADVDILQPGAQFDLNLQVNNVGSSPAKRVTMILGGGSGSSAGGAGTPQPGGVSGAGGNFGNFAPVASSNVQFLGDLDVGASLNPQARLIVNASTNPGAYPMTISFTYTTDGGSIYTDDQVVTLLVYSPPQVEVNFYRDPGPLMAGQPNALPIQVVNLGRNPAVLGNMKVTAAGGQVTNDTTLVGALDTGGYFTLDAMLVPEQAGPMNIDVAISYTDDFNQPQVITRTIPIEVQEVPVMEPVPGENVPGGEGMQPETPQAPETFWQKVVRFFRGLLGLDSGQTSPQPVEVNPETVPPVEVPARPSGGKG